MKQLLSSRSTRPWARYGATEIARRYLPQFDWLPARLEESQSAPVPGASLFEAYGETVQERSDKLAAKGARKVCLDHSEGSTARFIALDWPSPKAIAAARGLLRHAETSASVRAFVVGLERQLGCAPSDAMMVALLDDISALKDPLDEASAIIELLRFTPTPLAETPPTDYDCLAKQGRFARQG